MDEILVFLRLLRKRRLPYVGTPTLRFHKKSTHPSRSPTYSDQTLCGNLLAVSENADT